MHDDARMSAEPSQRNQQERKAKACRITVTLPPEDYKELCAIAEKHRVSASWVVRDAVDRYLTAEMPLLRQNSKRL